MSAAPRDACIPDTIFTNQEETLPKKQALEMRSNCVFLEKFIWNSEGQM